MEKKKAVITGDILKAKAHEIWSQLPQYDQWPEPKQSNGWLDQFKERPILPSGYTNEGICIVWLDHFIDHNDCRPDKPWRILLIDGAKCHEAPEFILKAKMNHIWIIKFPSHQTHLIQPADVGCFWQWKRYQQNVIMNAIQSYKPEYNIQSFF